MQKKIRILTLAIGGIGLSAVVGVGMPPARASHKRHSVKSAHQTKITAAQAQATALRKFHGSVVGKTVLENEEGKWQYAVMVQSGHTLREVMVGAYSGKIEDVEVTTSTKEQTEKKAEEAAAKGAPGKAALNGKAASKSEAKEAGEKNEGKEAGAENEKTEKK